MNQLESEIEKIEKIMDRLSIGSKVIYQDYHNTTREGIILNITSCDLRNSSNYYCNKCRRRIKIKGFSGTCMFNTNPKTWKCHCKIVGIINDDFIKENEFMME